MRCEATRKNKDAFAPELGDYFADGPVLLWAQAAVNRHLDDWYAELLAEHQAEGHEDAMVESRTRISASVLAAGLKLGRRASFLTSLRTLSTMRDNHGRSSDETNLRVKVDNLCCERRVTTRFELQLVQFRLKPIVVHK